MSDPHKQETPDALDQVRGTSREQSGEPEDGRPKRRGDVDQADIHPNDPHTHQFQHETG